jgi:hypothetical protein
MSHPWDFETNTNVTIDADDILDYVKENKEWFLEQLEIQKSNSTIKENIKDLSDYIDSIIDKYDKVRIVRDSSIHNQDELSVKMYEDLINIKKSIGEI